MGIKVTFVKKVLKSPNFWVRQDSLGTGVALIAEGVTMGIYLSSMPLLAAALSVIAAPVLIGCGLYCLSTGLTGQWSFVKKTYREVFNKAASPKEANQLPWSQKLKQLPIVKTLGQKISGTKLFKKFMATRLGQKIQSGLTPPQHDIFMTSLNLKGGLVVGGGAAAFIFTRVTALSAITLGGIATPAIAIASYYLGYSIFGACVNSRVLFRAIRSYRASKKSAAAAKKQGVMSPQPSAPLPSALTPEFQKTAPTPDTKETPIPQQPPQLQSPPPPGV